MKNSVFVDTVAWLALVNKSEDLHNTARTVRDQLIQQKVKLITTDFVVVEIANSLARLPLRGLARKLIDFIRTTVLERLVPF
jgi:predicted nucleic acid-binding protein